MKIGVELKIDVTNIEKARLYKGEKGTYLTMTTFIDVDTKDQYDNNGMITHKKNEGEERAPILGNCKVFWRDSQQQEAQQPQQQYAQQQVPQQPAQQTQQPANSFDDFDSDIPF